MHGKQLLSEVGSLMILLFLYTLYHQSKIYYLYTMRKMILTNLLVFACVAAALANGDPVMRLSSLIGSSNPVPREITDIQILREELYIRPGEYSHVVVKYLLWNNSDKDYTDIDYGFPVDYKGGGKEYENSAPVSDYISDNQYVVGWHDDYIRGITFSLNEKSLPWKPSEEAVYQKPPFPNRKNYADNEEGQISYDIDVEGYSETIVYRRWFYTQFSIKKGEIVTLEVRYALRNWSVTPLGRYPSICGNELVYDLSPACHWGDGTARELSVRIDASDLADHDVSIKGLPSSDIKQDGAYCSYMAKNFTFREAEPIRLNYDALVPGNVQELLARRIPTDKYEIIVEKEAAAYPASNLSDMNFSTACVTPKGDRDGDEYVSNISIRFHEPTRIEGFALVNGYHKSETTYLNNNRLSYVSVTFNGSSETQIIFNDTALFRDGQAYYENNDYEPLYFGNMIGHPDVAFYQCNFFPDRNPIREIKLQIWDRDIYPGAKYNDTCLSEIIFFGVEPAGNPDKKSEADDR